MTRFLHLAVFLVGICCLTGCNRGSSEIKTLYTQWQKALANGKFDEAYLLMTEEYRTKHTIEQFRQNYTLFSPPPPLGNEAVVLGGSIVPAVQRGVGVLHGSSYGVSKVGNVWRFTGVDGGYVQIIGDK